jgi:hypothetical protein
MGISTQTRAGLFKKALETIPVGGCFRCPGIDDDELCSNKNSRNNIECSFCGALSITERSITIRLVRAGIIKKERSS